MGNRAAVAFVDNQRPAPHTWVYLHWNGGPESVYPMIEALRGAERLNHSASYATAQLASLAVQYIGKDGLSVGIERFSTPTEAAACADDNGAYVFHIGTGVVERTISVTGDPKRVARKLTAAEVAKEQRDARAHRYTADNIRGEFNALLGLAPQPVAA